MERKFDLVLLYSGGYDSTLLLELAEALDMKILCVLIDYGQKHKLELEYARSYCKEDNIPFEEIHLTLPVASNLTDEKKTYDGVSPWHVPSRNLIFIGLAVSIAESHGIPLVWYGANYEDREHLFPDCYQEWVFRLNQLLEINGSAKIKVEAPLLGMSKETIKGLANKMDIKPDKIFSGYGKE